MTTFGSRKLLVALVLGDETLLKWATAEPLIEKVCLEVFTTNIGAIRLYRKLGFVEEGLRPKDIKFGPERYVDTLTMYKFVG